MRIVTLSDFGTLGSGSLPTNGTYHAVAIASGSELDACIVGGIPLGVGGVVPFASTVTALRNKTLGGARLQLALYEACDVLPPGPRAPLVVSSVVPGAQIPGNIPPVGDGDFGGTVTVPVYGRKRVSVHFERVNPAKPDVSMQLSGYRTLADGTTALVTESPIFTWSTGGASAAVARFELESFDYVGAGFGGSSDGDVRVVVEASGELSL